MKKLECIPKLNNIDEYLKLAEAYDMAFEYNEFFDPKILSDKSKVAELIREYRSLGRDRSSDTLHGAFFDVNVASDDPEILKVSDMRVRQSMEAAEELGVRAVVLHTNYISNFRLASYRESWVSRCRDYYTRICEEYPNIDIFVENMFDGEPDLLYALAREMEGMGSFGVCFDFAHAFVSQTKLPQWTAMLKNSIRHIHINDNFGTEDSHLAVGQGALPWKEYDEFMRSCEDGKKPSVLIEVSTIERLTDSINYLRDNAMYPFCRSIAGSAEGTK